MLRWSKPLTKLLLSASKSLKFGLVTDGKHLLPSAGTSQRPFLVSTASFSTLILNVILTSVFPHLAEGIEVYSTFLLRDQCPSTFTTFTTLRSMVSQGYQAGRLFKRLTGKIVVYNNAVDSHVLNQSNFVALSDRLLRGRMSHQPSLSRQLWHPSQPLTVSHTA